MICQEEAEVAAHAMSDKQVDLHLEVVVEAMVVPGIITIIMALKSMLRDFQRIQESLISARHLSDSATYCQLMSSTMDGLHS